VQAGGDLVFTICEMVAYSSAHILSDACRGCSPTSTIFAPAPHSLRHYLDA